MLVGARVLAASDDTVGVWAATGDLSAGTRIGSDEVELRRVRFPDADTADRYLAADAVPDGTVLNHPVAAGELLPRSALSVGPASDLVEVPLSVLSDDLPATVREGSVVDVWVSPKVSAVGEGKVRATRVLADVLVVAVPRSAEALAPQATRQVIVGVPASRESDLGAALGDISDGRVVIARKG